MAVSGAGLESMLADSRVGPGRARMGTEVSQAILGGHVSMAVLWESHVAEHAGGVQVHGILQSGGLAVYITGMYTCPSGKMAQHRKRLILSVMQKSTPIRISAAYELP
jgi:hypothetical protein